MTFAMLLGLAALASPAADSLVRLDGRVLRPDGTPVVRAVVTLLEAADSALTLPDGRFTLLTRTRGLVTVVVRRIGFTPATADVILPADSALAFTLVPAPSVIGAMRIEAAGEFRVGGGSTGTLTPLDIAQTPGAAANVARALQTLPGTQAVDEGTGLFVRGGDVTETRVLVDDAVMLSPARFDNPTGHVTASLNPFLLSRATLSSGGFGAMYGNALSGLVRLETAGRPAQSGGTLTASIGSLAAAGAWAPARGTGLRVSAGLSNLGPLMATFGEAQPFAPAPRGGDAALTLDLATSAAGRVRLFGLRQRQEFGVGAADASGTASYRGDVREGLTVLSWRDSSTWLRPSLTWGESAFTRGESFGGFALDTRLVARHAVATLRAVVSPRLSFAVGADDEQLRSRYVGAAASGGGGGAGARSAFDVVTPSDRRGVMGDVTARPLASVQVVAGVRTDRAALAARRTVDPRLSIAWERRWGGLTASWGRYTQVAEPVFFRGDVARFAPMRLTQAIVGVQLGDDTTGLRLEVWDKRWRDLQQFTPDFDVASGGTAWARGADLHVRWQWSAASKSRLAWSMLDARRTDPVTGREAPAPADVRHSITWITDRIYGPLTVSSALRWATGRPFTDIVGTTAGPGGAVTPVFGDPFGARLPTYWRSDVSLSWFRPLPDGPAMVLWGTLSNVFARDNIMRYTWSADFTARRPVRAPFNRSLYVGATLLY